MSEATTLPIADLRRLVRYEAETGLLFSAETGIRVLARMNSNGYFCGEISGRKLLAHRAAWAIVHGSWPTVIDHINRVKTDNRLCNLREASWSQNALNSVRGSGRSPFRGVAYLPSKDRWVARFQDAYLGCFATEMEAAIAYDATARIRGLPVDLLNFQNETHTEHVKCPVKRSYDQWKAKRLSR